VRTGSLDARRRVNDREPFRGDKKYSSFLQNSRYLNVNEVRVVSEQVPASRIERVPARQIQQSHDKRRGFSMSQTDGHILVRSNPIAKNCVRVEGSRELLVRQDSPDDVEILDALSVYRTEFRMYFQDMVSAQNRVYEALSPYLMFVGKPFFSCDVADAKCAVMEVKGDESGANDDPVQDSCSD
jgi:rhamnose utilization protein RhaD (predicted bifunctional aldolase and dehydrogenase)